MHELLGKGREIMTEDEKKIYQSERDKLGVLPDADNDFIALYNTWKIISDEKSGKTND